MTRYRRVYLAALILCLGLSACLYRGRPEVAPLPDLTGQWRGAVDDSVSGGGALTLDLFKLEDEDGAAGVGGTWRISFGPTVREGDVAYTRGAESGLSLELASDARCAYDLEASVKRDQMKGTYLTRFCTPYALGTFELEKQP